MKSICRHKEPMRSEKTKRQKCFWQAAVEEKNNIFNSHTAIQNASMSRPQ